MVPLYPIGKGFFLTYFLIYAKHRSVPLNQGVKVKSEFLVAVLTVEGPFTRVDTLVVFKLILLVAFISTNGAHKALRTICPALQCKTLLARQHEVLGG